MPKCLLLALALALAVGCRRADVRTVTISIPGLAETNRQTVVSALSRYAGVKTDSFQWDMEKRTLTLRYDSMQVAQANLRYAIEAAHVAVAFPEKTDDRAGH